MLTVLQSSVAKNPRKADLWIGLGRAWVRKARESSDPGYYAHADACARIALSLEPANRLAVDLQAMVLLNDHKFEAARSLAEAFLRVSSGRGLLLPRIVALGPSENGLQHGPVEDTIGHTDPH